MIVQAFGYSDLPNEGGRGRRPTVEEFRFMTYDALVHGAAGVIVFGSHQLRNTIPLDEPLWDIGVRALGRELAEIGGTLRHGHSVGDLRIEPASLVARGVRLAGREYVLAVNESAAAFGGTLHLDAGLREAHELPGNRRVETDGHRIAQTFGPWGVHVYRITR
jgi:hypothetical protein